MEAKGLSLEKGTASNKCLPSLYIKYISTTFWWARAAGVGVRGWGGVSPYSGGCREVSLERGSEI